MVSSISRRRGDKSVLVTYDGFKRWVSSAKSGVFSPCGKAERREKETVFAIGPRVSTLAYVDRIVGQKWPMQQLAKESRL